MTTLSSHVTEREMDSIRKWEEMNSDCLVNIFGRLDLESRLADVPFVCKHWHKTLISNPLCWQSLVFYKDIFKPGSMHGFHVIFIKIHQVLKFVVDRSQGCATTLVLPDFTTADDLIYVSDACPNLKVLSLVCPTSSDNYEDTLFEVSDNYEDTLSEVADNYEDTLSEVIVKFKNLEILQVARCSNIVPIILQIRAHCDNFVGLTVIHSCIDYEVASAIVSNIATIKFLILDCADLENETLMLILQGCKQLEQLHVRKCFGFDEENEEIHKFASHIKDFKCESSTDEDDYDFDDPISSRDVDFDFLSD